LELREVMRSVLAKQLAFPPQTALPAQKKRLIISIDGGGTRGIIPCVILERILERFPDFCSRVSVVSGVLSLLWRTFHLELTVCFVVPVSCLRMVSSGSSIGAMIAMSLAFNYHPSVIRELLERTVRHVFGERNARLRFAHARWSNHAISMLCQEMWGTKSINDASLKVLVSGLLLDNNAAKEHLRSVEVRAFHNFSGSNDEASSGE
jgi:patatin-like phospholipase/acyl hydrolase